MKCRASTLLTACDFLSSIGTDASGVTKCVMRIIGDRLTLCTQANGAVAEYVIEDFTGGLYGSVVVDLHLLHRIAKEIDQDTDVRIFQGDAGNTRHRVVSGSSVFRISAFRERRQHGSNSDDESETVVIPINGHEIRSAFSMVESAAGRASDPENLRGVCFDATVERVSVVTTNGSHLACWQRRRPKAEEDETLPVGKAVVPNQYVALTMSALEGGGQSVIRISKSSIDIRCGRRHAVIPKLGGYFPHWRRSVEHKGDDKGSVVAVDASDFYSAISEARIASDRDNPVVGISGTSRTIKMEVIGDCDCNVNRGCKANTTKFGPIYLAVGFLRKAMAKVPFDQTVRLMIRSDREPVEIRAGFFVAYVMPMRREEQVEEEKVLETAGGMA